VTGCREPSLPVNEAIQFGVDVFALGVGRRGVLRIIVFGRGLPQFINQMADIAKSLQDRESIGSLAKMSMTSADIFFGSDHPVEFVVGEGYKKDKWGESSACS